MKSKNTIFTFFSLALILMYGSPATADVQGYAGPGWSVLFGPENTGEMASLGPVMFRVAEGMFFGPVIAYEESASEGPGVFLGGVKIEGYPAGLSRGFYSTSAGLSVLAGASDLNSSPRFAVRINAEITANFLIFPDFQLAAGPLGALHIAGGGIMFLPGFTFSLKEGTRDKGNSSDGSGDLARTGSKKPLIYLKKDGLKVGGYWQGLWVFTEGQPAFIDGGGTRIELPSGLAFGITGGVLREKIMKSGSSLAVMLTGITAGWNIRPADWFAVTPRLTAGLGMYGWTSPDGAVEGGPHFMVRPELCAYIRILPFLRIGGGVGYQFVTGKAETAIPVDRLSSPAFSLQVRVGE